MAESPRFSGGFRFADVDIRMIQSALVAVSHNISAGAGDADAQYSEGDPLMWGESAVQGAVRVAEDFKLSADEGHPEGQLNYRVCPRDGVVVDVDHVKAAEYLKLSAD
jgi:TPR repeat protein